MRAKSCSRWFRSLAAIALTFAAACGDYEDFDDADELGQAGQSASNPALPDADAAVAATATPDAASVGVVDASVRVVDANVRAEQEDAGALDPVPDAGRVLPVRDAGTRADAGSIERDAGPQVDSGSTTDACDTLTYANFGMQFVTTYCAACHSGASAKHGVQLDTLAGIQKNKAAVKRQTVTGMSMPSVDPKPSAAERQKLGQWLDCGAN